jgi:plastocyanin
MNRLIAIALVAILLLTACGTAAPPPPTVAPTLPPPAAATQFGRTAVRPDPAATLPLPTNTAARATAVVETPYEVATAAPAVASTGTAPPTPNQTPIASVVYMTLQDFVIVPDTLTIPIGAKVLFLIKSAPGSFHQPYSSFPDNFNESGLFSAPSGLGDGTSYAYTFTKAGTYTVRCGYHPAEMVATITVTP